MGIVKRYLLLILITKLTNMKKLFFCTALLLGTAAAFAQTPACPTVKVSATGETHKEGVAVEFSGSVSGTGSYTYNWSVSGGIIESGQGTPAIRVNTDGTAGTNITATMEVGGIERTCPATASATVSISKTQAATESDKPAKGKHKVKTKRT